MRVRVCVCVSDRAEHLILRSQVEESSTSVCERECLLMCVVLQEERKRYALGSRLLSCKTPQMVCAVCASLCVHTVHACV